MKLWPQQEFGLSEIDRLVRAGRKRIVLVSPTGGGKTKLAIERMIASGVPSAFYTHRRMLLGQTGARFEEAGLDYGFRASKMDENLDAPIQLAMIQSEASAIYRKKRRSLHNAKEILIDEAHANSNGVIETIIDDHNCVTIGLTATPLGIGHIYEDMVIAGTNSELRECGSHVIAHTFGPSEPDTRIVGKVKIGEGECGITQAKRSVYSHKVFGDVVEHYRKLNPEGKPTLLFAPGVQESIWFCEQLNEMGISAAHIDGGDCWLDGELVPSSQDIREEIEHRCQSGDIKIVCNRFVLREGVDWPFIHHGIFATIFGSLTSYLQAGGRIIRNHPSMDHCIIQDHGGNWWRHGSLNADREWRLEYTDRIIGEMRLERIRQDKEREPIHCAKCNAIRLAGKKCWECGYQFQKRTRPVLQSDGSLKEMTNATFKPKRRAERTESLEKQWIGRVLGVKRSKKDSVKRMTFAQLQANFTREKDWYYPPLDLPMMPTNDMDWFLPVQQVTELTK